MKLKRREPNVASADREAAAIENQQRDVRVSLPPLQKFLARMNRELKLARGTMAVRLIADAQMARLNRTYRGKPKSTDVLSFPAEARQNPARRWSAAGKRRSAYLGDVAISPVVARRNAKRFGRTLPEELQILILHGALHLLGYDHEVDDGEMERIEMKFRRRLGIA